MGARTATYKLFNDDCINISKHCRGSKFDLIYLDPPFGTGQKQNLGGHSYDDCSIGDEYIKFISDRVKKLLSYLDNDGALLVHLDRHYVYEVKNAIDKLGIPFQGDIIWNYRRWASNINSLQNNHDTILIFSHNLNFKKSRSIFSHSIVAPSSKERVGYPTQKPLSLLKRIIGHIEQYTKINSVLDPFMGSGTTLVAGFDLGKKVYGFDISKQALKIVDIRLKQATPQQLTLRQIDL